MSKIVVINRSGLFQEAFTFEFIEGANWFSLEGKTSMVNQYRLTFDVENSVGAAFRDELGNKYSGFICNEEEIISSVNRVEAGTYFFVEEDEML